MDNEYKYDVFISYSRKDTAIANKITAAFDKQGITYFIDRQNITGGMEFPAVLARAIKESKVYLFLASKNSYASKFTQSEIVYAFNKKDKKDFIPYIIDGSSLPEELEFTFSSINWRNIKDHPIDTVLVNDVLRRLKKDPVPAPAPTPLASGFEFSGKTVGWIVLAASIVLALLAFMIKEHYFILGGIFLVSMLALIGATIIGLIRPASLCLANRGEVCKSYLVSAVLCFIAFGIYSDKEHTVFFEEEPEIVEEVVDTPTVVPAAENPAVEAPAAQTSAAAAPKNDVSVPATPSNDESLRMIEEANRMQQANSQIIDDAAREAANVWNNGM